MATILVVDDRPTNRQFLLTLLGYRGHGLLEAANGAEALERVRTGHPDLVITDILMPTMDGYEFVQRLRAEPEAAPTEVIFYTATYSEKQARALADTCGVRIVLPKPSDPEKILAAVDEALGVEVGAADPGASPPGDAGALGKVDDQLADFIGELQAVKAKFDGIAESSGNVPSQRDELARLSEQFSRNVINLQRIVSRLSAIIDVGMEISSERQPKRLVELFFAAACDIIDSRYAAIGMLDEQEYALKFVFAKSLDAQVFQDADRSRKGLLGALLAGGGPVRGKGGSGRADEALPPGHPEVRNFLGVPVASKERVYGWMLFADSRGGSEFGEEDACLASMMATRLAVLYENAVLYDVIQRHAAQLQVEISERRHAERAARESEAKFRELIEQASDGVFATDSEGNFKLVNSRFREMLHYEEDELLRLNVADTYPERERPAFLERLAKLGETKSRLFERMMKRKDGTLFPVEVSVRRLSSGLNQGIVRDITERNAAAAALAESEFRFRQLTENITEVFWLTDPAKNEMLYISPAYEKVWARDCGHLYASPRDWVEAIHSDDRERVLAAAVAKQARGDYDEEYRIVRPDGSTRWVRDRAFPVRDAHGRVYRIAGVAEDVTERKEAEIRITSLNRVYAVLSGINKLIVRVRDRRDLFDEACRIAVEAGNFGMAWIGEIDRTSLDVAPVAWMGMDGDVALLKASARPDVPEGQGMVGRAIRGRKPVITNDIGADPGAGGPRRKEALRRGFNSIVAMPLIVGGEVSATLTLFARERNFFSEEELKLLTELADDISFALDHIEKADRLDYLAYYDATTGIANRKLLLERLDQRIRIAAPRKERLALAILDIERFKSINDTLGRHTGDQLLKAVADRFAKFLDDPDRLGRVLGDQFGIIIPDARGEGEVARRIDEKLRVCVGAPIRVGSTELRISAKAGVALYPDDGSDADALFRNAEAALKRAKAAGERCLFYAQKMTERVGENLALENKLRLAVENEEFVLHYQPKVDAATRKIEGMEALIRWHSPGLGLVPPAHFIPLLEETGLILEAGAWALRRAALDYRRWSERRLNAPRVAVNVSAIQMRRRDFVETALASVGAGEGRTGIDIEVTESLAMEDIEANIGKFEALRRAGMEIAIDDFGTGYSSLGYLAKLPVQSLKIDRSFIVSMLKDPAVMTLVSTIVSLAHTLRLKVVAEGVESEEQAIALARLGCDQLQGYLIARPLPFDEITKWLEAQAA
ncbi:MAG TPA: EAL domain-containing protein [Burkholderiales bacterium]|nr:EAL domain-containing protein [Burkholderiales bacterium]